MLLTSGRHLWIGFSSDDIGSGKFKLLLTPTGNKTLHIQVIFPHISSLNMWNPSCNDNI